MHKFSLPALASEVRCDSVSTPRQALLCPLSTRKNSVELEIFFNVLSSTLVSSLTLLAISDLHLLGDVLDNELNQNSV